MNTLARSQQFKSLWSRPIFSVGNLYTWGGFSINCGIQQETQPDQLRPRLVDFFNNNVNKVSFGPQSSAVITDDGNLFMFGCNKYGQLGIGSNQDQLTPVQVSYFREHGLRVQDVAVGEKHTVALASDGQVYSWGHAAQGLLSKLKGEKSGLGDDYAQDQLTPQPVSKLRGGVGIQHISAGADFTTVITKDQVMYNWGVGRYGTHGNGLNFHFAYPERNPVIDHLKKAGFSIQKLKSSHYGSLALLNDGTLVGWGHSYYGSLGVREQEYVATDLENFVPIPVNQKYMRENEKVVDFDLGFSVSIFYTNQGRVYISGSDSSYVPRPVEDVDPSKEKVLKVSASNNSFAILTDKNFYVSHDYLRPVKHLRNSYVQPVCQKELFNGELLDFGGNYFTRYAIVKN